MAVRRKRTTRAITAGAVAHAQILDAAANLFYLQGARNVGIDAVVKRAGVNKMSLYRQFDSKEDLLRQYLLRTDRTFWAYFDASADKHPGDPRKQLRQFFVDLAAESFQVRRTIAAAHSSTWRRRFPIGHMWRAAWWLTTRRACCGA